MEPGSVEFLHAVLFACVTGLSSSCTEGETVEVLAAWVDDERRVCVLYQYPYYDGVLGLRLDTETDMFGEPASDPAQLGQDIADFNIGEPLGSVAERLREDVQGVHWWGSLNADLPTLPDSTRLRRVLAESRERHAQRRAEKAAMPRHGHLARRSRGSDEWMLTAKPFGETWYLTAEEVKASDDEIKQRFNLASLTRGGHWVIAAGPPPRA